MRWSAFKTYCVNPVERKRRWTNKSFRMADPVLARGAQCDTTSFLMVSRLWKIKNTKMNAWPFHDHKVQCHKLTRIQGVRLSAATLLFNNCHWGLFTTHTMCSVLLVKFWITKPIYSIINCSSYYTLQYKKMDGLLLINAVLKFIG